MAVPVVILGQTKRPLGNKPLVEKVATSRVAILMGTCDKHCGPGPKPAWSLFQ